MHTREEYNKKLLETGLGIKLATDIDKVSYHKKIKYLCHCGNEFMAMSYSISTFVKKSCGCLSISYLEIYTFSLLKALNIDFTYQKAYLDLKSDFNG